MPELARDSSNQYFFLIFAVVYIGLRVHNNLLLYIYCAHHCRGSLDGYIHWYAPFYYRTRGGAQISLLYLCGNEQLYIERSCSSNNYVGNRLLAIGKKFSVMSTDMS